MASVLSCSNHMGYSPSSSSVQARDGCEVPGGRFHEARVMALLESCRQGTIPLARSSRRPSRMKVKKGRHEQRLDSSDYEAAEWVSRVIKDPMVEIDPITVRQQISADEKKIIDLLGTPNVMSISRAENDAPPSVVASGNCRGTLVSSAAFAAAAMFAVVQLIRFRAWRSEWGVIPGCECSQALDPRMTHHGQVASTEGCAVQSKVSAFPAVSQFGGFTDDKTLSVASMHGKLLLSEALEDINYFSAVPVPTIEVVEGLTARENSVKLFGELSNSIEQVGPSCSRADKEEHLGFVAMQQLIPKTLAFVVGDQNVPLTLKPGSRTIEGSSPSDPPTLSRTKHVFEPSQIPAEGNKHAKTDGFSVALDRKIQEDKRDALHRALQGAVPVIAIGGGAGGVLAGVDGALEVVGLVATISFVWYELLWAKRRHQLWAELSAVSDHQTLAMFLKSRKFTTDRQAG